MASFVGVWIQPGLKTGKVDIILAEQEVKRKTLL